MNSLLITARTITDSRGKDTLEVTLSVDGKEYSASVPGGTSTGSYEVKVISPHEAVKEIDSHKDTFISLYGTSQEEWDRSIVEMGLSGAATLALSFAYARARAGEEGRILAEYIANILGLPRSSHAPRPMVNVVNGGAHAHGGYPFQEYLLIPQLSDIQTMVESVKNGFFQLAQYIDHTYPNTHKGLEGGYALSRELTHDVLFPLSLMREVLGTEIFQFGIDSANAMNVLSDKEKEDAYIRAYQEYHLAYLEDPYGEDEVSRTHELKKKIPTLIAGDDMTATNSERITLCGGALGAVIIKPNQNGTLTGTLDAVRKARELSLEVVASHRSGETMDDWIVDVAYGIGAWGIKIGAPTQKERLVKYERLLSCRW